jgi:methylmalonyl-CoA/ethylmalonyl-CoA epimerase
MSSAPGGEWILLAIDHVGLAVGDLEAAILFHTRVLGLELRHREDNLDQGVAEAILAPVGAGSQATRVQLVAPLTPESPLARFLDHSRAGMHHLAYLVTNVEWAAADYRRKGLRLLYDSARPGTNGSLINFVHPGDTGGVLIELVEVPDRPREDRT